MSVQSIINYIENKGYIIGDEISPSHYLKGEIKDYYDNENLINLFKEKFEGRYLFPTNNSIIINNEEYNHKIFISYKIENDEIYWIIKVLY